MQPASPERRFQLTAAILKGVGVFDPGSGGDPVVLDRAGHRVRAVFTVSTHRLTLTVSGPEVEGETTRSFDTIAKASGVGSRIYFLCPTTGKRFDELWIDDGELRSRPELAKLLTADQLKALYTSKLQARVLGEDGRGPARGDRRRKLTAEIARRQTGEPRFSHAATKLKTTCALPSGEAKRLIEQGGFPPILPTSDEVLRRSVLPLDYLLDPLRSLNREELDPQWEAQPRTGLPAVDCLSFNSLDFQLAEEAEDGKAFSLTLGRTSVGDALLTYPGRRGPQVLITKVQGVHGHRFVRLAKWRNSVAFVCPILGEPTHYLFLRDHRLGGWEAQNIVSYWAAA